jgi:predicted nucleic acid-binding protein
MNYAGIAREHMGQNYSRYNLKFIDALHYSTAIRSGCRAIMTNDNGIRTSDLLEVISLSTLRASPEQSMT